MKILYNEKFSDWLAMSEDGFWTASRMYTVKDDNWYFGALLGEEGKYLYGNENGEFVSDTISFPILPVITIKAQSSISSGEGNLENPYIISSSSVTINDGSGYTNDSNITLNIFSPEAATMCISFSETCENFEPFSSTKKLIIDNTEGSTTDIYVTLKNFANQEIDKIKKSITIDTMPPIYSSIKVLDGERVRDLEIHSEGASSMCFSTSPNVEDCSNWENYNTFSTVTLELEKENQTIYGYFKDKAGNIAQTQETTIWLKNKIIIYEDFEDEILDSNINIDNVLFDPWIIKDGRYKNSIPTESYVLSSTMISFSTTKESVLSFDYGAEGNTMYGSLSIQLKSGSEDNTTTLVETTEEIIGTIQNVQLNANEYYSILITFMSYYIPPMYERNAYIDNIIVTSTP